MSGLRGGYRSIFLVFLFILSQFVENIPMAMKAGVVRAVVVGFLPIIFILSRTIWIHIFIRQEGTGSQILIKLRYWHRKAG